MLTHQMIFVLGALLCLYFAFDPRNRNVYHCPGCGTTRPNEHSDGCHFKKMDGQDDQ